MIPPDMRDRPVKQVLRIVGIGFAGTLGAGAALLATAAAAIAIFRPRV